MRFPVFARRSNPAIDPPIVRKSFAYCEQQVLDGLAEWINPELPKLGILAKELLPRDTPLFAPEPLNPALPPSEIPGLKFDDPEKSAEKLAERALLVANARAVTYFGNLQLQKV